MTSRLAKSPKTEAITVVDGRDTRVGGRITDAQNGIARVAPTLHADTRIAGAGYSGAGAGVVAQHPTMVVAVGVAANAVTSPG
jgi:hypothetical protein